MSLKNNLRSVVLSLTICGGAAHAADDGLITKPSKYSVNETVTRFEEAVEQKEAAGFMVFTEIDHAAAAKKFGLHMRPRTVIVFGNPKLGTPSMVKTPLLAIDVPPKALVWDDWPSSIAATMACFGGLALVGDSGLHLNWTLKLS